jgi:hypothetical protein
VEVGDVAQYFNAERGQWMLVVSWTGEELEVYRGMTLPPGSVEKAFGLPAQSPLSGSNPWSGQASQDTTPVPVFKIVLSLIIVGIILFSAMPKRRHSFPSVEPKVSPSQPPPPAVTVGRQGSLEGNVYRVTSQFTAEIASVGSLFNHHEYILVDQENRPGMLIYNFRSNTREWILFNSCTSPPTLTPVQAAALQWGAPLEIDGVSARITRMLQTTVRDLKGEVPGLKRGSRFYGVVAESGDQIFLGRWNQENIGWQRGKRIPEATVVAAFK